MKDSIKRLEGASRRGVTSLCELCKYESEQPIDRVKNIAIELISDRLARRAGAWMRMMALSYRNG